MTGFVTEPQRHAAGLSGSAETHENLRLLLGHPLVLAADLVAVAVSRLAADLVAAALMAPARRGRSRGRVRGCPTIDRARGCTLWIRGHLRRPGCPLTTAPAGPARASTAVRPRAASGIVPSGHASRTEQRNRVGAATGGLDASMCCQVVTGVFSGSCGSVGVCGGAAQSAGPSLPGQGRLRRR